jgi:hypothetical protein
VAAEFRADKLRAKGISIGVAIKRAAKLIVGWGLIVLGFIGLFLPVLQGILFILAGLIVLSTEYTWANRLRNKLKAKCPAIGRRLDDASAWVKKWSRRFSSSR